MIFLHNMKCYEYKASKLRMFGERKVTFDTRILCVTLRVFVCFRADIEVVQSDVSELEVRLDKVRFKHLHTLL